MRLRRSHGFEEASAYGSQVPLCVSPGSQVSPNTLVSQVAVGFLQLQGALTGVPAPRVHMLCVAAVKPLSALAQVSQVYTPSLSAIRLFAASDAQSSR